MYQPRRPPPSVAGDTTKVSGDISKDVPLTSPPEDSISSLRWSPVARHIAVGSWDSRVRIYDVTRTSSGQGVAAIDFEGPVLTCDWSRDGQKVAGAGADRTVRLLDLAANGAPPQTVGIHDAPIRALRFSHLPNSESPMIVTGSWDRTVRYWDLRSPTPAGVLNFTERVYSMDVKNNMLVIATADRGVHVVQLQNPTKIYKSPACGLKNQLRDVSCFTDGMGCTVGEIGGKVHCLWTDEPPNLSTKNYTFKCHRDPEKVTGNSIPRNVYAINAISFYPGSNVFSTAGSDGTFNFWDRDSRYRLAAFQAVGGAITATDFSKDGAIFAYAVGYDWSKGYAWNNPEILNKVVLHEVKGDECRPRPRRLG